MKVYRYKNYDFENEYLPLGFEWKEPEIFVEVNTDPDYELCTEQDCEIEHLKDMYKQRELDGHDLNLENTANGYKMLLDGTVSSTDLENYGNGISGLSSELDRGYWHSSYFILDGYTPSAAMLDYHNSLKQKVKDYVNANYESYFHIA